MVAAHPWHKLLRLALNRRERFLWLDPFSLLRAKLMDQRTTLRFSQCLCRLVRANSGSRGLLGFPALDSTGFGPGDDSARFGSDHVNVCLIAGRSWETLPHILAIAQVVNPLGLLPVSVQDPMVILDFVVGG